MCYHYFLVWVHLLWSLKSLFIDVSRTGTFKFKYLCNCCLSNNKNLNIEASVKFFVLSALSSGFLLFGISLLYGATGTLFFNELTEIINSGDYNKFLLSFSLVFLVSAIAFKIGVIPFHMWLPDVYEGSHIHP